MVIALPVSKKKETSETTGEGDALFGENSLESEGSTVLEQKLETLLSSVEGVGKVKVILMTGEKKDSQSFYDSGTKEVTGVLIAAQGADDGVVSRNIVEAVMALFQVDAHKIRVMKMK